MWGVNKVSVFYTIVKGKGLLQRGFRLGEVGPVVGYTDIVSTGEP